jgi:hypothetical protein
LAIPHVNSIDFRGFVLEEAVAKTAGRGSNISTDIAFRVDIKRLQAFFKLEPPTADIRAPGLDFNQTLFSYLTSSLVNDLSINKNLSRCNESLGFVATRCEFTKKEKFVQSNFF